MFCIVNLARIKPATVTARILPKFQLLELMPTYHVNLAQLLDGELLLLKICGTCFSRNGEMDKKKLKLRV